MKFDLYLLFCHTIKEKKEFPKLLENTYILADKIVKSGKIQQLDNICFLKIDPNSKHITRVCL